MRTLFLSLLLAITSTAALADDPAVGQRCKPLRPLKATDKVGGTNCYCESSAFLVAAGFSDTVNSSYYPKRLDELARLHSTVISTKTNFILLEDVKALPRNARDLRDNKTRKLETYNFYQASDMESGAGQYLLSKVTVLVEIFGSRDASCSVIKAESPYKLD